MSGRSGAESSEEAPGPMGAGRRRGQLAFSGGGLLARRATQQERETMSRKIIAFLIGAVATATAPAQAGQRLTPEAELARALEGRVAGEPVDCVNLRLVRNSQVIDRTALLFDTGSIIYVNRPRSGAATLNRYDTQVVRPFNSRLCSIDTVQMVDLASGMPTGIVFLDEFVPYRRVRGAD